MLTTYRQKLIEALIDRDGGCCCYCRVAVRKNWLEQERYPHDATVDHVIPKSKGGPNNMTNYALACRRCNTAKGNRDLLDFLNDPRTVAERKKRQVTRRRRVKYAPAPGTGERVAKNTLAAMLASGRTPVPRGATLPKKSASVPAFVHSAYQPPRKMTGLELARMLQRQHGPWPLA